MIAVLDIVHINEITIADSQHHLEYFTPNCNECKVIGKRSSSISS